MEFDPVKLTTDLISADKAAHELTENILDDGPSNFDSVYLCISEEVSERVVIDAVHQANLQCYKETKEAGNGYIIMPNVIGQGNKRSKAVEVMMLYLRAAKWDAGVFYCLD